MMLPKWNERRLRVLLLSISTCLIVLFSGRQAIVSQPVPGSVSGGASTLPTVTQIVDGQEVTAPDFSRITIRTLGAVEEAGEILGVLDIEPGSLLPDQIQNLANSGFLNELGQIDLDRALGFEFGRVFEAGDSLAEVLRIGDLIGGELQDGLETVESLWTIGTQSLETIGEITGRVGEIADMFISDLDFLQDLDVVELVGGLRERVSLDLLDADIVENIEEQLENVLGSETFQEIQSALGDAGEVLGAVGTLGSLADGVQLGDVPALTMLALEHFPEIRNFAIDAVPFLEDVPLDRIAAVANNLNFIVRIDQLYGSPEGFTRMTQSGGFNPPPCNPPPMPQQDCEDNGGAGCPHIEAFNLLSLVGTDVPGVGPILSPFFGRWVSGQAQEVEGGCGPLRAFNGGMEPTGLHPFGSVFKFALWDIDDTTDTVTTRILFRICVSIPFIGRTCTPYAIPPQGIPFIPFSRDSFIPAAGVSL